MLSLMYVGLHVTFPFFLSYFNEILTFSIGFWKMLKYNILEKSGRREPGCSMRMDRQTDRRDEGNSYFEQICERA